MGIIDCPIHGLQGFEEVCEHIWNDFDREILPAMNELPISYTKLCKNCFNEVKSANIENITLENLSELSMLQQDEIEEKILGIYDMANTKLMCIECLNKLRLIDATKLGKKLPFESYENTLMYKDNEIIEKLRTFLISNFNFPELKEMDDHLPHALFIRSGGITYPFTIKLYYIIDKQEQEKLLHLIDSFFEDIPQKQRHISFYETYNWIAEDRGIYGKQCYLGEQKLLLEKMVK